MIIIVVVIIVVVVVFLFVIDRDPINFHGFLLAGFFFHGQSVVVDTGKAIPVAFKFVFPFLSFDKGIALFKHEVLVEIKEGVKEGPTDILAFGLQKVGGD